MKTSREPTLVPEVEQIDGIRYDNRCPKCRRPVRIVDHATPIGKAFCPFCNELLNVVDSSDDLGPSKFWS